jgi:hypothetical protein
LYPPVPACPTWQPTSLFQRFDSGTEIDMEGLTADHQGRH